MFLPGVRAGVTTALLDIDGTLLDSNDAHAHAWVEALSEAGHAIPFTRVRPLIGMGADQFFPELDEGLAADSEPGKSIAARRGEIFKAKYLRDLGPTPGARELLVLLRDNYVACVIATSATSEELDALLAQAGIADLIEIKSTASDAQKSKPMPDIVHAALRKGNAVAESSVMIGDTRFDIAAAALAGVQTIAFRCGGAQAIDLAAAAAIYDDPAGLAAAIRAS